MAAINVKRITNKMVTTKYGEKAAYSVQGDDGTWYKHGFKKPAFKEGDAIEADIKETSYGPEITSSKVVGGVLPTPRTTGAYSGGASGGGGKPFPIPPLHGDRSIIRQNSLTNAREAWVNSHGGKAYKLDEEAAHAIIDVARIFESYSCGDIDMAMAKKMAADSGVDVEDII
jgi:hypothetical protein